MGFAPAITRQEAETSYCTQDPVERLSLDQAFIARRTITLLPKRPKDLQCHRQIMQLHLTACARLQVSVLCKTRGRIHKKEHLCPSHRPTRPSTATGSAGRSPDSGRMRRRQPESHESVAGLKRMVDDLVACMSRFCRSRLTWSPWYGRLQSQRCWLFAMSTLVIGFWAWRLGDAPLSGDGVVHRWMSRLA